MYIYYICKYVRTTHVHKHRYTQFNHQIPKAPGPQPSNFESTRTHPKSLKVQQSKSKQGVNPYKLLQSIKCPTFLLNHLYHHRDNASSTQGSSMEHIAIIKTSLLMFHFLLITLNFLQAFGYNYLFNVIGDFQCIHTITKPKMS